MAKRNLVNGMEQNNMWFHTHFYSPSPTDPNIIYCWCGEIKHLKTPHEHDWERKDNIINTVDGKSVVKGFALCCRGCGDYKEFRLTN